MVYNNIIIACPTSTLCLTSPYEVVTDEWLKLMIERRTGIPSCELVLRGGSRDGSGDLFIEASLRLLGGKGGFGALLRGAGAATSKIKISNDDCRDLSGRRIRHVKNEQRLAEWYAEQK